MKIFCKDGTTLDLSKREDLEKFVFAKKLLDQQRAKNGIVFHNLDYSEEALRELIKQKYEDTIENLKKDKNFNVWDVYAFLKQYVGINDVTFTKVEYWNRLNTITKVLKV